MRGKGRTPGMVTSAWGRRLLVLGLVVASGPFLASTSWRVWLVGAAAGMGCFVAAAVLLLVGYLRERREWEEVTGPPRMKRPESEPNGEEGGER